MCSPQNISDDLSKLSISDQGIALPPLRIAAFNIQVFGSRKMKKENVADILVKILQRYDLILIQEIRDSSATALDQLVEKCSQVDPDDPFTATVSERLGRTHSKEQYAFMYRASRLSVKDTYQYDDGEDNGCDAFQREPYAVRFTSPLTEIEDFAIIAIHTDPDEAVKEIGALHKVHEVTKKHWGLEDIIIAGDFNADEGYVNRDDWEQIALKKDKKFKWLIDDCTDTTVGNTDRAYDRFVVTGKKLISAIVPGSTGVFRFDEAFGMTPDEAEEVSDHYPIELQLKGKADIELQKGLSTSICVVIDQKTPIIKEKPIREIYRTETGSSSAYFRSHVNYDDSKMMEVVATRDDVDDVIQCLKDFQKAFPGVVFDDTVQMAKAFMDSPEFATKKLNVYGLCTSEDTGKFAVTVTAKLQDPLLCSVMIRRSLS